MSRFEAGLLTVKVSFALASAAAASPTDAQRRQWARPARRGPASSVQAKVEAAILELLALGEFLEEEKASWLAGPSSSNGPAPVDDGTNSALVALIMRLAEAQDVALGWLNEQTVSMADGPAQSAWKAVVGDALSAVHAARSEGTATVVEVGEVVDGGADQCLGPPAAFGVGVGVVDAGRGPCRDQAGQHGGGAGDRDGLPQDTVGKIEPACRGVGRFGYL